MTRSQAIAANLQRLIDAGIPADEARTEIRLMLQRAAQITREALFLGPDIALDAVEMARFEEMLQRREHREPLAYIFGERDFYGLTFIVSPAVLVPRPETELLVELALQILPSLDHSQIVDIGTGSGCIAAAIAKNTPHSCLHAVDLSPDALAVAERNFERLGVAGQIIAFQGDLFAPLPPDTIYDIVVSNPPYIAPTVIESLEPEVRDFEPRMALGQNSDDLYFYRRLACEAIPRLRGALIVEVGMGQAEAVADLFATAGFHDIAIYPDLAGIPRAVIGHRRI